MSHGMAGGTEARRSCNVAGHYIAGMRTDFTVS